MDFIPKSTCYRVTAQRNIVLEELKKVCTHPTAQEVFELVKKHDRNVSLATVYRGLDFLVEQGLAIKLETQGLKARYDGNLMHHCHLVCKKCGKISDCFDVKKLKIDSTQIEKIGFCPCLDFLEIPGLCRDCCGC